MSDDGVTLRETLAYWTFLPMLLLAFGLPLATAPAWLLGYTSLGDSLIIPWVGVLIALAWVALFGDAVMPAETYRRRRDGRL